MGEDEVVVRYFRLSPNPSGEFVESQASGSSGSYRVVIRGSFPPSTTRSVLIKNGDNCGSGKGLRASVSNVDNDVFVGDSTVSDSDGSMGGETSVSVRIYRVESQTGIVSRPFAQVEVDVGSVVHNHTVAFVAPDYEFSVGGIPVYGRGISERINQLDIERRSRSQRSGSVEVDVMVAFGIGNNYRLRGRVGVFYSLNPNVELRKRGFRLDSNGTRSIIEHEFRLGSSGIFGVSGNVSVCSLGKCCTG